MMIHQRLLFSLLQTNINEQEILLKRFIVIDTIRSLYLSGDFQTTKTLLIQYSKKYEKLSEAEKSFVTGMLMNLDENEKALSLLKEEIPLDKLINESDESLKRQIYLAQIKIRVKSINVGVRILKNVLSVVETKLEHFDKKVLRALYNIAASNLRIVDEYESILEIEQNYPYPEQLELRDYQFKLEVFRAKHSFHLEPSDLEAFYDFFKNAQNDEVLQYLITFHELKTKILFGYLKHEECHTIEERLNKHLMPPTFQASHSFLIAQVKFLIGDYSEALSYLKQTLKYANLVHERHGAIHLINKIDSKQVSQEDHIFLRCVPINSTLSYIAGNRYIEQPPYLYPLHKNENVVTPQKDDCWWITKNDIILKNYFEIHSTEKTIDFYSGIITENGQVKMILTDLRIKLIRIIFGCGSFGAHQSYLIDEMFDGTYYFYESAHLRLKNLVAELNKMGIHINRKKNFYFYNFEKNKFNVIFPCNHSFLGPLIFLFKTKKGSINRKDVETQLNIKPSTASLYLKQWKEKEYIQRDSAKYGDFKINIDT